MSQPCFHHLMNEFFIDFFSKKNLEFLFVILFLISVKKKEEFKNKLFKSLDQGKIFNELFKEVGLTLNSCMTENKTIKNNNE